MSYIRFDHINKYFGENHVLRDITLDIEQGELVTFLGPSGCGKSTLLRCLSGLESVTEGKIYLEGYDITELEPKKRGIGMVFQQYSLFPNLTVEQNVAFGLKIQKRPKREIYQRVQEMLEIVGLNEKIHQYPRELSGGQQQRVALARALVTEPKVLLLDEPLSAIDALLRRNLQVEIRRIQKELNITTLFVTHDQDEAIVMSDHIHLFNVGTIEQSGVPVELYTRPRTRFAATFIGHYNIIDAKLFGESSGMKTEGNDIAIRPEIIEISKVPPEHADSVTMKGSIAGSLSHGNIIRYMVECGGFRLDVDILFDASKLFADGEEIYLTFGKEHVLELE
ncbi:ABC transporter ATP-binding protein [Ruminococcus gauvreauii]|uniref:ABC transporter ATP-binding protein n=1 Tax=Ruminococcus gauvreauii TaxID=438033 RepID=A0ABY5VJX7_9FIRM|nr:ABC transporter ATP-binding protein [Ruminococcus gauvreauii]UWP60499.1 ABC transporter ATP-binding protein [Ruminococcus gauvreauii]